MRASAIRPTAKRTGAAVKRLTKAVMRVELSAPRHEDPMPRGQERLDARQDQGRLERRGALRERVSRQREEPYRFSFEVRHLGAQRLERRAEHLGVEGIDALEGVGSHDDGTPVQHLGRWQPVTAAPGR